MTKSGIIIKNKPAGISSFNVVANVRKEFQTKKVGHIGTLDPMASGVLPILVNKATKLSNYLIEHDKEYYAVLKLGQKTDTLDREGTVIEEGKAPNLLAMDFNQISNLLKEFARNYKYQVPPMYSAIKINGKKLYEYARKNQTVEVPKREVNIYKIELLSVSIDRLLFRVECSKGTYIRTLCEDIAKLFSCPGYMSALLRTRVGKYKIEDSNKFISLEEMLDLDKIKIKDEHIFNNYINGINIDKNSYKSIYKGKDELKDTLVYVYYNNSFIGIAEKGEDLIKRFIVIEE